MKKLVLSFGMMLVAMFAVNTTIAQAEVKMSGPELSVDKDVHDYGQIAKDANGDCYFTITNTGSATYSSSQPF